MYDLRAQAKKMRNAPPSRPPAGAQGARAEKRAGLALLLFVAIAGLPVIGVPVLRERLRSRSQDLVEALALGSVSSPPLRVGVGENTDPFPAEYDKPAIPLQRRPAVLVLAQPYAVMPGQAQQGVWTPADPAAPRESAALGEAASDSAEPVYVQGKIEREAYEVLLASLDRVQSMVGGNDRDLKFQDWAAARMDEDRFLVKLTFTFLPDGSARDYVWQVRLMSKEVVALSAYARAVSRP
ncbi:MAG: hypothetical protein FJW35_08255 [Acidobacteria bacterium]|nr:hypothetical protein [Acidobacteriota bacterium]